MEIIGENIVRRCAVSEIYKSQLEIDGKQIQEVGFGCAEITRAISITRAERKITAL